MQHSLTTGAWWAWLRRLTLKELRESLRDRRTTATLLLMPILLYPVLSLAFQRFLTASVRTNSQTSYRIGIDDQEAGEKLKRSLEEFEVIRSRAEKRERKQPLIDWFVIADLEEAVRRYEVDLGVKVALSEKTERSTEGPVRFTLFYCPTSARSEATRRVVEDSLRWMDEFYLRRQLRELKVPDQVPYQVILTQLTARETAQSSLASLIPLILLLMTVTGAVYPAIDTTAGERERGTLEVLMASPVPRLALLFAKFGAVWTVAILTAAVNLAAMTITLSLTGMSTLLFGEQGLTFRVIVETFALLMLFAAFFSAALLALTSAARSFKEAQAYLIPLMLVALAPGLMSLSSDLTLNKFTAMVPLLGDVLLARDLFQKNLQPLTTVMVVVSTLVYAGLSLWAAARIFGTDAVLYGGESGWSDLVQRPEKSRRAMTLAECGFCLVVMFPAYFAASHLLGFLGEIGPAVHLQASAVLTIGLFALWPTAVAAWRRVELAEAFQIHRPSLLSLVGAAILGVSLWPLVLEIVLWTESIGLVSLQLEHLEKFRELIAKWRELPVPLLVGCLALTPAVCEEWFFRGMVLRSLLARETDQKTLRPILLSAVLFGLFHLVVTDQFAFERFLPSALLGCVLGMVAVRSGSVFPGMVLHTLHNSLVLTLDKWAPTLGISSREVSSTDLQLPEAHLPAPLLIGSVVVLLVAIAVSVLKTKKVADRYG